MIYAISAHLSIEREALLGMTAAEVVAMSAEAGDAITEQKATEILDCAAADKAREAEAEQKPKKHARN